jgi:hypothetical protein
LSFAVAMKPRAGLYSRGRSLRNPFHSYFPVPGTGRRPLQPSRSGVRPLTCRAMLPAASPQIRLCVGTFQDIARSKKSSQPVACASFRLPLNGAVPGSWLTDRAT